MPSWQRLALNAIENTKDILLGRSDLAHLQLLLIDPYDGIDASVENGVVAGLRAGSPKKVRAAFERATALGGKIKALP